ncbi:hypothetical protein HY639_00985 [Candidatus Woesearchaeota archaeon]|nr:hypothetical protein [Candidatus Woesearchaeota archaeon]
MATFLDVSLVKGFSFIFPFLLVWTVLYATLEYRQFFGPRRELHAIIAFVTAMLVALTKPAVEVVSTMTPWFIVLLMVFMMMVLFFKFFGIKDEQISGIFSSYEYSWVGWWIVIISLILFAASLGKVFFGAAVPTGEQITGTVETTGVTGIGEEAFLKTLFHPKVLGLIFLFIIASLTIKMLAGEVPLPSGRK